MRRFLVLLLAGLPLVAEAQFKPTDKTVSKPKPDFYKWKFGGGMNIVDDKGTRLKGVFKTQENWNALAFPSRISAERHLEENFSAGLVFTANRYKEGKNIIGVHITAPQRYMALDAEFKYFFNNETGNTQWFDPYILSGIGISWIDRKDRLTINAGLGFNIWFTGEKYKKPDPKQYFSGKVQKKPTTKQWVLKHVGINFQTLGKVCVDFRFFDNQIQHSCGLVVRL